jgi:hypothetical protein
MEFNFDSEDNVKATKTPFIKVLNDDAKLWISDENVDMCRWREDDKTLIPHTLKTDKDDITIPGNIILNLRMLILQRSLLLKVETKIGRILSACIARESKEENTYMCVRKYMILFVDEDNPLHEVPLQLSAKVCFQFEFDQQLCDFRAVMTKAFNEKATFMKNSWCSMCVFVPTFKSMVGGEGNKQKKVCITTEYENLLKRIGYRFVLEDVMILPTSFGLVLLNRCRTHNTYINYTAKQGNLVKLRVGGNEENNLFFKINQILKILRFRFMPTTKLYISFYFNFTLRIRFLNF